MKKMILKSTLLAVASVGLLASGAMATMFVSSATIDQNFVAFDAATLSGTAEVNMYLDNNYPDITVNQGWLLFEADIFSSISNFTITSPNDWTTSVDTNVAAYQFNFGHAGTEVTTANDPLTITFDYILNDLDMFTDVSGGTVGDEWAWNEDHVWNLAYGLENVTDLTYLGLPGLGVVTSDSSSGSTSPVPEPATMFLFGTGLAGLAGFSRKKSKKA